ncbi:MAG: hypothetical protein QXO30_01655 [Candidatus Caldarchaeum sp.]
MIKHGDEHNRILEAFTRASPSAAKPSTAVVFKNQIKTLAMKP